MFYTFLLVILVLDSIVLMAAILMQAGKGGGLAASFGGASSSADAFIGIRQAGNLLTKISWTAGGIFLFLAFVLQIASTRSRAPQSVLDRTFSAPATAPAPAAPVTGGNAGQALPLSPAETPAAPQGGATTPAPATPAPTTPQP